MVQPQGRTVQQQRQQNLERIRNQQIQAQRRAQMSRMQPVQSQAHPMQRAYLSASSTTNGKVKTSSIGNVTKEHVRSAKSTGNNAKKIVRTQRIKSKKHTQW